MDFLSILFIAIGLAMDCLAISFSLGLSAKNIHIKDILLLSFSFGFFQLIMPLFGYGIGQAFVNEIRLYDHWISFLILSLIGGKMIYDSLNKQKDEEISDEIAAELNEKNTINFKRVILLSFATSIDALASGLIFVPFPSIVALAI
jgi:putative Mn2+ efflux pump MntP